MLTDEYLTGVSQVLADVYGELELELLSLLLENIENTLKSDNYNIARNRAADKIYRDALLMVTRVDPKVSGIMTKTFKDAIRKSYNFDTGPLKDAGITVTAIAENPYLLQIINSNLDRTLNSLRNLSQTSALTLRDDFISLVDRANIQVTLGNMNYNQAINQTVKDMANKGVTTVHYATGAVSALDTAVRRAVLTGVNQTALQVSDQLADEIGTDLVSVSSHWGAREGEGVANHAGWQGKIYSKSGSDSRYPYFATVTGYGTGAGLGGWNCRHSFYPYVEGVSSPSPQLPNKPDIKYQGKTYTYYEATQRQRQIERHIRKWKREENLLGQAKQDTTAAKEKIKYWQKQAREFTAASGVPRRYDLEKIVY